MLTCFSVSKVSRLTLLPFISDFVLLENPICKFCHSVCATHLCVPLCKPHQLHEDFLRLNLGSCLCLHPLCISAFFPPLLGTLVLCFTTSGGNYQPIICSANFLQCLVFSWLVLWHYYWSNYAFRFKSIHFLAQIVLSQIHRLLHSLGNPNLNF
jgi:hypothetical protein